jgi:hypothetical protein
MAGIRGDERGEQQGHKRGETVDSRDQRGTAKRTSAMTAIIAAIITAIIAAPIAAPAATSAATPAATQAACTVAPLPIERLALAAERIAEPSAATQPSAWWRLGALLPGRLQLRRNDGVYLGFGEVLGTSGSTSERSSAARTAGWSVSLTWNLERLWLPPAPRPTVDRLARSERQQRLLQRLATLRTRHGQLRADARELEQAEDPRCDALVAEAEALAWAICGALGLSSCQPQPSARLAPPP